MRVLVCRALFPLLFLCSSVAVIAQQASSKLSGPQPPRLTLAKSDSPALSSFPTGNTGGVASLTTTGNEQDSLAMSALPQAPEPQTQTKQQAPKASPTDKLPAILAPQITNQPFTSQDKFKLYIHQVFSPVALIPPAFGAALQMANPPNHYPHEWRAGGPAFGRLYGDSSARRASLQTGQVLAQIIFHEDPRYLPSVSHNAVGRVSHALIFTAIDRSDSGHGMPALANFSGAAAQGFVGMGYLPDGYADSTHALQRSAIGLAGLAGSNLVNEFCPEWGPVVLKLHLPFVHPPCPDRMPAKHP